MTRFVMLVSVAWLMLALSTVAPAAEAAVLPAAPAVEAVDAGVQAAARRLTRADRKLAREIIADAAEAAGMRRLAFMRAVAAEDADACMELKVSVASHDAAVGIDPDRLQEILDMIRVFIEWFMSFWMMFA